MTADRELAEIYARQATRAGRSAVIVALAGALGTLVVAFSVGMGQSLTRTEWRTTALFVTMCVGAVLTATLYAVVSHLQTHAEAAAARHVAAAIAAEADV
ncbi:hypothetical protein GCM10009682_52570 [Luedemannella flava]|uniref:Phage holin family protein n=1 Tax=Luedemannella flava TaxID=349316 RepID=A0ABN2MJF8_9ACTN